MPKQGINWETTEFFESRARFVVKANFVIQEAMKQVTRDIQAYMQQNAPWEDQSGNARKGLRADLVAEGFRQTIELYDVEDYEVWLEIRWDGQYAIIIPTMEKADTFLQPHLTGVFDRTDFTRA